MATAWKWLDRTRWALHSSEVGALREIRDRDRLLTPAMVVAWPPGLEEHETGPLYRMWCELAPHPRILEPLRFDRELLVRYAAIDWMRGRSRIHAGVATWGVELTKVFELVAACVDAKDRGWFTCPFVKLDVEGEVRVGFMPPTGSAELVARLPPEQIDAWPLCDERGLVFVVGRLLQDLVDVEAGFAATPLGAIVARCADANPAQRYPSLRALRDALADAGALGDTEGVTAPEVFECLETGVGYLALGRPAQAISWFDAALSWAPESELARHLRAEAVRRGGAKAAKRFRAPDEGDGPPWQDAEPIGRALEEKRAFSEALAAYRDAHVDPATRTARDAALARCHFQLGEYGHAIDFARRTIARRPDLRDAHEILCTSLLRRKVPAEADAAVDAWCTHFPDDGRAHYTRGKVLLALGRVSDARDVFDRVCHRFPSLIEAMLLRREVDRMMGHARTESGAPSPTAPLPDHLVAIHDVLVTGRVEEAIAMLREPPHDTDPLARRTLANLLLSAGEPAEALALFEELATDNPEALEGVARALEQLGNPDEAELAFAQYVERTGRRSELRVRSVRR